jgi:hypothetical protein
VTAILVSGALASRPHNAGGAWVRLSWIIGLAELGCDVWFVEEVNGASQEAIAWFESVAERFGLTDRCALINRSGRVVAGRDQSAVMDYARDCDLLVNISGNLRSATILSLCRRRAFVDLDPGYTQYWMESGIDVGANDHDVYFTVAERLGKAGCGLPTAGVDWMTVRQPVVLSAWPFVADTAPSRFTTITTWRTPFGPLEIGGVSFGMKAHEFRKLASLPSLVEASFEIATDIHSSDDADRRLLEAGGWIVVNPNVIAPDPELFRTYIQESAAEISPVQPVHAATRSGWFSDRSTRYLASGRPVLVQDTGLSELLPIGQGLVTFTSLDEASSGAQAILADYASHASAARQIAVEVFGSNRVLPEFLVRAGLG